MAGATPEQIAYEANSAAHHALEDVRDVRARHAEVHVELRDKIDALDRRVGDLATSVAEARGEAKGQASSTRIWFAIVGVVLTVVGLLGPRLLGGH